MEGRQRILLVLIFAIFSIRHLVQAQQQDQQGFVSLDCGLPTKESYIEPKSNLKFSSDAEFIQTGKSGKVAQDWLSDYKQYNVLRYFPVEDGLRNCYNLKVNQGTVYLIRAGFSYGNYDGLNKSPKFDMYIGPNLWTTVDSPQYEDNYEIIHRSKSNNLQICLVKTGETTPMISTLELRPLRDGTYVTQSGSLRLLERSFFQSDTGSNLREGVVSKLCLTKPAVSEAPALGFECSTRLGIPP